MYSEEIKRLLILKRNLITTEEYQRILTTSPQIQSIKYNTFTNEFEIRRNARLVHFYSFTIFPFINSVYIYSKIHN